MTDGTSAQKYMTKQEAATVLGVDPSTVDRLITTGALTRYRLRERYIRVLASEVAALSELPAEWLRHC